MQSLLPDINSVLQVLADKSVVRQYEVLLYERTPVKFQLKLRIDLTDHSVLFTNDYVSPEKRKYAFQWQNADDTWLMRWDNAPHFSKLAAFPHHRHDYRSMPETVSDSHNITLADALDYISRHLNQPTAS
jgi:hypothetical protein